MFLKGVTVTNRQKYLLSFFIQYRQFELGWNNIFFCLDKSQDHFVIDQSVFISIKA